MAGIIIYESSGHYTQFGMTDNLLFDLMKDATSTPEGIQRYGLKYIAGKKIPIKQADRVSEEARGLIDKLNQGEPIDSQQELDAICDRSVS